MKEFIYGNKIAKLILMQGLHNDKIAHAYLIHGEKGLGKKTFAKYFAMSVLCQGQGEAPCLVCNTCKKILSGIHPDYKEYISPERKLSVGVDFVRELKKDSVVKPNESDTKVYVITDIQNMTLQAHNAFLKTLEEPPKNTLFLLTTNSLEEIPETIVSRTVLVPMFPLNEEQMRIALDEKASEIGDEALKNISSIDSIIENSNGNLAKALSYVSDSAFEEDLRRLKEFSLAIAKRNEYDVLKVLSLCEKDKLMLTKLMEEFSKEMNKALLFKLSLLNDSSDIVKELAKRLAKVEIIDIIEFISIVINKLETNANYNLMLAYICTGIFDILD